jgi:hypothetical protein
MEQLVKVDPANSRWQQDLAASHERIAKVLFSQGNKAGAVENMKAELTIWEKLAKTDPTNVYWQDRISFSQRMIAKYEPAQDIADVSSAGSKISRDEVAPTRRSLIKSTKREPKTTKSRHR